MYNLETNTAAHFFPLSVQPNSMTAPLSPSSLPKYYYENYQYLFPTQFQPAYYQQLTPVEYGNGAVAVAEAPHAEYSQQQLHRSDSDIYSSVAAAVSVVDGDQNGNDTSDDGSELYSLQTVTSFDPGQQKEYIPQSASSFMLHNLLLPDSAALGEVPKVNDMYKTQPGVVVAPSESNGNNTSEDEDDNDNSRYSKTAPSYHGKQQRKRGMTKSGSNFMLHQPPPDTESVEEAKASALRSKRRTRTKFTNHQLDMLEATFNKTHYPDVTIIDRLSTLLNLGTERISIWFQNRRARYKKTKKCDPIGRRGQLLAEDDEDKENEIEESERCSSRASICSSGLSSEARLPIITSSMYSQSQQIQPQQQMPIQSSPSEKPTDPNLPEPYSNARNDDDDENSNAAVPEQSNYAAASVISQPPATIFYPHMYHQPAVDQHQFQHLFKPQDQNQQNMYYAAAAAYMSSYYPVQQQQPQQQQHHYQQQFNQYTHQNQVYANQQQQNVQNEEQEGDNDTGDDDGDDEE